MEPFFKSHDDARAYALFSINAALWIIAGLLAREAIVSYACIGLGIAGKLAAFFRYCR